MKIQILPTKIRKILISNIAVLILLNLLFILVKYGLDNRSIAKYLSFFYFDKERSVPTVFSGLQLFISSILLFIISLRKELKKIHRLQWTGLSLIFLFLTFDELISIHEPLISVTHGLIDITSEYLTFAWVIPYSIGCLLFVLLYFNFLKDLPPKTRMLFIVSGTIFCSGAIGVELIGGKIFSQIGQWSWQFAISTTIEETLEMIGICLFIYALTNYLAVHIVSKIAVRDNESNKIICLQLN